LAAPALAKLGVPLIVSHMFAFYYGIMADLSPPAALAAAPIAKENPDKIGWEAMRIALAGDVIPFIFVYSPALMLQGGDPLALKIGFVGAVAFGGAPYQGLVPMAAQARAGTGGGAWQFRHGRMAFLLGWALPDAVGYFRPPDRC
jgi:TRAP-type uncharacterized transport system fused permease subunit